MRKWLLSTLRPLLHYPHHNATIRLANRTIMGGFFSKHNATFDPAKDIPDLTGKVMIVTGGK